MKMTRRFRIPYFVCLIWGMIAVQVAAADESASPDAEVALQKAVQFFRKRVSANGGYLWRYSSDLSLREGEGTANDHSAWVQPPGTPSVGNAFLAAYEMTGDRYLLDAAIETANALVQTQLQSGGWYYRIEFKPEQRRKYAYRSANEPSKGRRNTTTLDDNNTQSAIRFLMRVDRATDFKNGAIHEATRYALDALIKVQYPNGAWPQAFSAPPDRKKYPVLKATLPQSWSRTHPKMNYRDYYTFNDNTIADTVATMFEAAGIYQVARYRSSATKAGEFILLAQLPAPQPAWAQQYNSKMQPAWARRFEPPSITGLESQGVMRTLMLIYRHTANRKFLDPIPRALAYLKKIRLPDGRLARFYELRTDRPLYFTKKYELTYNDNDLPTHYGFKVGSGLERIEQDYKKLLATPKQNLLPKSRSAKYRMSNSLTRQTKQHVDSLDSRGAWVEAGSLRRFPDYNPKRGIITTSTFVKNIAVLARYVAATRSSE